MHLRAISGAGLLAAALTGGCGPAPEPAPGVDLEQRTVALGALVDLSGPVAAIGRPWTAGLRILVQQVNAGGSGFLPEGWKLTLVERDHAYAPDRALAQYETLRDRVLYLACSFGTANTLPLRPLLARDSMIAFPASLSARLAESEFTPPIGPSYAVETLRALDWMAQQAGGAAKVKLGLVYQDDDYGAEGRAAVRAGASALSLALVAEQAYTPGEADYSGVVAALRDAGATHVMLTTVPSATAPILALAHQAGYKPLWVGNSPAWLDRFFDDKVVPPEIFDTFRWVTATAYWGENLPFMRGFLAAYAQFASESVPRDHYILTGYSAGLVGLTALSRAIEAGEVTRAGFLRALRGLKDYDTHGTVPRPLDYTQLPYRVGTLTRVLRPDFARASWSVVGGYKAPSVNPPPPGA